MGSLTETQKEFIEKSKDILTSEGMQMEKTFTQHNGTTVYDHSLGVAYSSYWLLKRLHIDFDEDALVRGALLHDYFLYDWHVKEDYRKWHGFRHPGIALKRASQDFEIGKIEANIIHRHMFPLTPIPPKYREAIAVCLMDKVCACAEFLNISYLNKGVRQELVMGAA